MAGRQCMNFVSGFSVSAMTREEIWNGSNSSIRVRPRLRWLSHRDPDVRVEEVSAPHRILEVVGDAQSRARFVRPGAGDRMDVSAGHRALGPQILVSMPSNAPVTSNELAVLFRASPT